MPDSNQLSPDSIRNTPVRVLLIIGSTRHERFGPVPAAWVAKSARERGDIELDVADLAELNLTTTLNGNDENAPLPPEVEAFGKRLDAADAVVIVTPVYNRGYPAPLKNAIDWFHNEWFATPVGFVSYGGISGGLDAVEQLRNVFVELNTMTIRNVLTFPNFWERFDDYGQPTDLEATTAAATAFFDQLTMWSQSMRSLRTGATT